MREVEDAMIVAGGAGTRLLPLTATVPKPLLPFCGAPFLAGVVRRLGAVGVRRVALVVGADPSPFEVLVPLGRAHGVEVSTVPEPTPLDTAGGVRSALDRVAGTFLVLNGDILTDHDLLGLVAAHHRARAVATIAVVEVDDTSTFGVCVREGTRIVDFVEKPPHGTLPGQRAVNAGTYVLEPEALSRFPIGPLSFERTVFPGLVRAGAHVEGWVGEGVWADLGTCERYLAGHRLALDGRLRWPTLDDVPADPRGRRVEAGARVATGATLDAPVLVRRGAVVEEGARVGPHAVLEVDACVGAGASVRDAVVLGAARIGAGAVVEGAVVGPGASVGEGAVVSAGVILGAGEHVVPGSRRG